MQLRLAELTLVPCLCFGSAADSQEAAALPQRLHPHMRILLAERGPAAKGWVFFADKGIESEAAHQQALARARAELSPRTLERRRARRVAPGLVDDHDLPVAPAYVERVLATGAQLAVTSAWLNAVSVRGTLEQFEAIAALPFVERVEPVRRGRLLDQGRATPPASGSQHAAAGSFYGLSEAQLDQIGLVALHARGYTGEGVVIGILDTGFHRGHEAFNQTGHVVDVVAEYDFIDDDANTDIEGGDPSSQHQHGTYILGTLAAYLPGELVGGAYEAAFVLCKTEDTTNEYEQEEDFYVAGLAFIEANGGDMATSSLGYIDWYTQADLDGLTAVTTIAVNVATQNGMPCVTAAGNSGHDTDPGTSTLIAPADALEVITAGAVDFAGVIASFSSEGPSADGRTKPELLAWGVSTATVCAFTDVDCTTTVSGTSLSTPLLASVVACLLEAHPDFTVGQLRARLFRTGDYFVANGTFDPEFVLGYGIPDADVAGFDCNGNAVDDDQDIALGNNRDCNGNGYPDSCDIADGISLDANANGRPDECEHRGVRPAPPSPPLPLTVLPPAPKVGGRIRLAIGALPSVGTLAFVLVRSQGAALGLVLGAPVAGTGSSVRIEIPLPDDMSLAGRTLQLRARIHDPVTGNARWSEEREVVLAP